MGSSEYSVMPTITVTLPAPKNTIRMPKSASEGMVCKISTTRRITGRALALI